MRDTPGNTIPVPPENGSPRTQSQMSSPGYQLDEQAIADIGRRS
jgi:hypothetical protein